jgi:hypothetical protein
VTGRSSKAGDFGLEVFDNRAFGGRAADIEIEDLALAAGLADVGGGVDPRRRARLDQRDRCAHRLRERRDAAVRLKRVERTAKAARFQRALDAVEMTAHHGLKVGIENRRAGALILAPFAADLMGRGHREIGPQLAQQGSRSCLMGGIDVAVQELDRDRLDVFRTATLGDGNDILFDKLRDDGAGRVDALANLEGQCARHERRRFAVTEIVEVGPIAAIYLQNVAKSRRRHQRGAGALPLQDRIDRHSASKREIGHCVRTNAELVDGFEHAVDGIRRLRQSLSGSDIAACLIEKDCVREGSADVNR